ncbi:MAG: hypothetical protein AB8C95_08680 [Phycisphaeraceae bacterium]
MIIGEQPDAYSMRWVTYSRQLMTDRKAAVERMLAKDAASFWADCAVKTRQIDDWPMIRLLAEKATQSEAAEALPWLIRSWAMRSKVVDDEDRPEREAIESITREPAEALLNAMVFKGLAEQAPATQVAAWAVLVRIESAPSLRERLVAVSDENQSGFVAQLKRIAPVVDMLPTDRLAVAQMMRMAVTHDDAQLLAWSRWRDATLSDGPATLAMRHLPAMVHRNLSRDAWSREQWIKHIGQRLLGRRFCSRGDGVEEDVVVKQRPDRFTDHVEALSIADLIVIDQLLDAMNDPAFQVAVFKQADTDLSDTTTEYGGALVWNEQNKLVLAPFAPLIHRHDQAYIASTPCIEAVYLGLAHVHFHAQRHENAGWAGPSQGDLDFVDAHHVNGLVLTFLDRNTLNVDAAFPSGIVIDLGCITR